MKCKICFKKFLPKKESQICCSRSCNAINHNRERGKMFKCPKCLICGKNTQRQTGRKYCSSQCQGIAKRGENHPNWNGGTKKHPEGYVYIYNPIHPRKDVSGYVLEHRLVMEKKIGRYLTAKEVVHHVNGIKNDNRITNLVLLRSQSAHLEEHDYFCDGIKRKRQSSINRKNCWKPHSNGQSAA